MPKKSEKPPKIPGNPDTFLVADESNKKLYLVVDDTTIRTD